MKNTDKVTLSVAQLKKLVKESNINSKVISYWDLYELLYELRDVIDDFTSDVHEAVWLDSQKGNTLKDEDDIFSYSMHVQNWQEYRKKISELYNKLQNSKVKEFRT